MIDLLIQPALQQPSFPHNQHLRLGVPRRVDVLLRRIGGGLVPRSLLLLRCGTWWGLLLVVLVPLLLLPLLPLLVLLLVLLPILGRTVSWLTRTSRASPGVGTTTFVA